MWILAQLFLNIFNNKNLQRTLYDIIDLETFFIDFNIKKN